jgi:adenine-specific DNA-methyltransferase
MDNDIKNSENSENPLIRVQTTDWNKERLEQLKQLMPDLFTNDGELNINELKKVVDPKSVNETERYEFRWFGKSNAKREAFTPTDATLVYDEARSVNPTESENLIIEGENLAVLKLLSNSYREQVKCIYIDPPYNTGNDFVYSDKFNQDKKEYWEDSEMTENGYKIDTNVETDGRFHSNWLNMMYSRLLIARQLLKEDGVIFISIDDNEVHHLRKLCDEVFGEENFVGQIVWKKKTNGNNMGYIPPVHDYIMVFAKSVENINEDTFGFPISEEYVKNNYSNPDNHEKGLWTTMDLSANHKGPNFGIENPETGEIHFPSAGRYWVFNENEVKKRIKDGRIIFGKNGNKKPIQRVFLTDRINSRFKAETWWDKHGMNSDGTKELNDIFKVTKIFDHSKPSKLIKNIVQIATSDNDILLDFFCGSGTTGQAITELNQEDGGKRKYILVQLPESTDKKSEAYKAGYKNISAITIERNKRVIEKIEKELQAKAEKKKEELPFDEDTEETPACGKSGLGFRVFKLVKSNFPRVEFAPDPEKSEEENIELLKKYIKDKEAQLVSAFNKDELITEILIKNGFKLNYTLSKQEQFKKNVILFATDGDKETLICLDVVIADETVEHFKTHTDQKLIVLERALDTTKKWNLKHAMGDKFNAF